MSFIHFRLGGEDTKTNKDHDFSRSCTSITFQKLLFLFFYLVGWIFRIAHDGGFLGFHVRQTWKVFVQISIALLWNFTLIRLFSVFIINTIANVLHPLNDFTNGCKSLSIQTSIVAKINKQLCGARVWTGSGVRQSPAHVGLNHWIVFQYLWLPLFRNLWITGQAKLNHKVRYPYHAKKTQSS